MSISVYKMIKEAVDKYGEETNSLKFLPENRMNRNIFPTQGQYDWFSGCVLYCLVRHIKPEHMIEVGMSSGYSTAFSLLAIKKNGIGFLDTFEIRPSLLERVKKNFADWDILDLVHIHIGDVKETYKNLASLEAEILFLDAVHTEEFAKWFIETFDMKEDTLLQIHDVLPVSARVKIDGKVWQSPLCSSEEMYFRSLTSTMNPDDYVYLYDITHEYLQLNPRVYDAQYKRCTDDKGQPFEWNNSLWIKMKGVSS